VHGGKGITEAYITSQAQARREAHRRVYHSTLGLRVIRKRSKKRRAPGRTACHPRS